MGFRKRLISLPVLLIVFLTCDVVNASENRPTSAEILQGRGVNLTVQELEAVALDNSADTPLRLHALKELGRTESAEAIPVLLQFLKASDPDLRRAALVGLRYLKHEATVPAVLETARHDPEPSVRRQAITVLAQIGGVEGQRALLEVAFNERETSDNRQYAIEAIGRARDSESVSELHSLLDSSAQEIRTAAAMAIGRNSDPRVVPTLVAAILDEETDESTRIRAVRALERATGEDFAYVGSYGRYARGQTRELALEEIRHWWAINNR